MTVASKPGEMRPRSTLTRRASEGPRPSPEADASSFPSLAHRIDTRRASGGLKTAKWPVPARFVRCRPQNTRFSRRNRRRQTFVPSKVRGEPRGRCPNRLAIGPSCPRQVATHPPRLGTRRRPRRSATSLRRFRLAAKKRPKRLPLLSPNPTAPARANGYPSRRTRPPPPSKSEQVRWQWSINRGDTPSNSRSDIRSTKDDLDLLRRQLGHDQLLLVKLTHPLHKPYINIYHISR